MRLRDPNEYPHLCAWLDAFESRPSYLATKSDMYTHVMDIPPQYGPGYGVGEADAYAKAIGGKDGSCVEYRGERGAHGPTVPPQPLCSFLPPLPPHGP